MFGNDIRLKSKDGRIVWKILLDLIEIKEGFHFFAGTFQPRCLGDVQLFVLWVGGEILVADFDDLVAVLNIEKAVDVDNAIAPVFRFIFEHFFRMDNGQTVLAHLQVESSQGLEGFLATIRQPGCLQQ